MARVNAQEPVDSFLDRVQKSVEATWSVCEYLNDVRREESAGDYYREKNENQCEEVCRLDQKSMASMG